MLSIWLQPLLSSLVRIPLLVDLQDFCVSVFDVIVHITNCSVGNSDPRLRIVFVHRLNSNFNSVLEVLKTRCDFQNRSNSRVFSDPPFWFRSWIVSRKGVFATSYRMQQKFTSICCHEVLSHFYNTHESCFLTEFTQSVFW